jgi:lysophospholipase L1-like esterase
MLLHFFLVAIAGWIILRILVRSGEIWRPQIRRWRSDPPTPAGGILFTGSSSIRRWKTLAKDMAPLAVINRGFGGAHLSHLTHFAREIFASGKPAAVVICAGENDLAAGKMPERVLMDFITFVDLVQIKCRVPRIYFISIKLSPLRRRKWDAIRRANELIRDSIRSHSGVTFIDINPAMAGPTGEPRRELWGPDGLHLSAEGYGVWTAVIKPVLEADR